MILEQLVGGHDHTGSAEAALQAMFFPEAFLDRMQTAFRGQSFDSGHFTAIGLRCKYGTRFDSFAIEEDCASSTL